MFQLKQFYGSLKKLIKEKFQLIEPQGRDLSAPFQTLKNHHEWPHLLARTSQSERGPSHHLADFPDFRVYTLCELYIHRKGTPTVINAAVGEMVPHTSMDSGQPLMQKLSSVVKVHVVSTLVHV